MRERMYYVGDDWGDGPSMTADKVIDEDETPYWSGLYDHAGFKLYKCVADPIPFGFIGKEKNED